MSRKQSVYLIGSLRNEKIPALGCRLREAGHEVFDDWHGAGPEADDFWQKYEKQRGRSYAEALKGHAAKNTFAFDYRHLSRCEACVLVLPAGKSGHLEFGYMLGTGKKGYVLFEEEPERWDVMYQFAHGVFFDQDDLIASLASVEIDFIEVVGAGRFGT